MKRKFQWMQSVVSNDKPAQEAKKQRTENKTFLSLDTLGIVLHFYSNEPEQLLEIAKTSTLFFDAVCNTRKLNTDNPICIDKITNYIKMKVFQNLEHLIFSYACSRSSSVKEFVIFAGNLKYLKRIAIRRGTSKNVEHENHMSNAPKLQTTNLFRKLKSFKLFADDGKHGRLQFLRILDAINEHDCEIRQIHLHLRGAHSATGRRFTKFKHLKDLAFTGYGGLDLRELKHIKKLEVAFPCGYQIPKKKGCEVYTLVDSPVLKSFKFSDRFFNNRWTTSSSMNWVFSKSITELRVFSSVILSLERYPKVLEAFQNSKNITSLRITCSWNQKEEKSIEKMAEILSKWDSLKQVTFTCFCISIKKPEPFHICKIIEYGSKYLETLILKPGRHPVLYCDCDLSLVKTERLKTLEIHSGFNKTVVAPPSFENFVKSNPSLIIKQIK